MREVFGGVAIESASAQVSVNGIPIDLAETFERAGFARAAAIGRVVEGPPRVIVER